jgi:hypothetical protein
MNTYYINVSMLTTGTSKERIDRIFTEAWIISIKSKIRETKQTISCKFYL